MRREGVMWFRFALWRSYFIALEIPSRRSASKGGSVESGVGLYGYSYA